MSENEADRANDDESTHLLSRVTSDDINEQQIDSEGLQSSLSATATSDIRGTSKSHISSLIPTDRPLHGPIDIRCSPSSDTSIDGVALQVDDQSTNGSRASLLSRRSSNYGALYQSDWQKQNRLRRLSFAEVVERITLTWENIDVYAPPAKSKPIVLRALSASSADTDSVQAKHILKDGMGQLRDD